jgi:hypothetical protein
MTRIDRETGSRADTPSRPVIILVILVCVAAGFAAGWFGRPWLTGPPDPLLQDGFLSLPDKEPHDVFYPRPYEGPPNLTIKDESGALMVVEQRADGFKVRIHKGNPPISGYYWQAKGVPAP